MGGWHVWRVGCGRVLAGPGATWEAGSVLQKCGCPLCCPLHVCSAASCTYVQSQQAHRVLLVAIRCLLAAIKQAGGGGAGGGERGERGQAGQLLAAAHDLGPLLLLGGEHNDAAASRPALSPALGERSREPQTVAGKRPRGIHRAQGRLRQLTGQRRRWWWWRWRASSGCFAALSLDVATQPFLDGRCRAMAAPLGQITASAAVLRSKPPAWPCTKPRLLPAAVQPLPPAGLPAACAHFDKTRGACRTHLAFSSSRPARRRLCRLPRARTRSLISALFQSDHSHSLSHGQTPAARAATPNGLELGLQVGLCAACRPH